MGVAVQRRARNELSRTQSRVKRARERARNGDLSIREEMDTKAHGRILSPTSGLLVTPAPHGSKYAAGPQPLIPSPFPPCRPSRRGRDLFRRELFNRSFVARQCASRPARARALLARLNPRVLLTRVIPRNSPRLPYPSFFLLRLRSARSYEGPSVKNIQMGRRAD